MDWGATKKHVVSDSDSITRRSSFPLRSDEKVQSRYLKPRTTSCHDLCKFAKKHDSEADAKRLHFKQFLRTNLARDGEKSCVTSLNLGERGTRTGLKPMNSVDSANQKKTAMIKRGTRHRYKPSCQPSIIEKKSNSHVKLPISSDVLQKKRQKIILPSKRFNVVGKPATPSKRKTELVRSLSRLQSSRSITRRHQQNKISRSLGASKIGGRKILKPSTASLSFQPSHNPVHTNFENTMENSATAKNGSFKTPLDSISKLQRRKLRKKIVKQISTPRDIVGEGMDSKSMNTDVDANQNKESESLNSGRSVEEKEVDNMIEDSEVDDTSRSDSTSAKRLRFSSENPNGDTILGNGSFGGEGDIGSLASDSEVQTVVLKHQTATVRKDAQPLFHHVIEGTERKLVEISRCKVKALVGVFETMISLQETNLTLSIQSVSFSNALSF